jgi:hypothetical protein
MRVGVDRNKYQIQIPLPPKIDPSVTMMTVEEKPDITYSDIGGCKEQIEKMREVVELPMLHPEKFVQLGIDPPKGVLCYGPPGARRACRTAGQAGGSSVCCLGFVAASAVIECGTCAAAARCMNIWVGCRLCSAVHGSRRERQHEVCAPVPAADAPAFRHFLCLVCYSCHRSTARAQHCDTC